MSDIPRAQDELFNERQSARQKYAALVVGRPGWGALVRHEVVTMFSQHVPGALGLVLRKALYPSLLGACGRNVVFGQNVVLRHPHKIRIGDNVVIDDNCLVDAKGNSNRGITIGNGVFIGRNTILSCKNGDIDIADGANIGFNCELFSASRVHIGSNTLIAAYCYVIGGDHDFSDPEAPVLSQARRSSGVEVGEGAWLGAGAKLLDGVKIGNRSIVGAGAVVRDQVPDGAIAVGIPARIVGQRATEQSAGSATVQNGSETPATVQHGSTPAAVQHGSTSATVQHGSTPATVQHGSTLDPSPHDSTRRETGGN